MCNWCQIGVSFVVLLTVGFFGGDSDVASAVSSAFAEWFLVVYLTLVSNLQFHLSACLVA